MGEQVFVGHSGGYPGHITKTLVDPRSGLTISVLTNAIDGPATPLARGIAQILAAAAEALDMVRAGTARVPPCSGFADRPQAFAAWVRLPRRLDSNISVSERAS